MQLLARSQSDVFKVNVLSEHIVTLDVIATETNHALGKFDNPPAKDLETWFIRGGSAGAATYTFLQPGIYAYVNHNLIEAVELGATAHFVVEGDWNDDLMMQVQAPSPIATN